jgi:hypothetical protein
MTGMSMTRKYGIAPYWICAVTLYCGLTEMSQCFLIHTSSDLLGHIPWVSGEFALDFLKGLLLLWVLVKTVSHINHLINRSKQNFHQIPYTATKWYAFFLSQEVQSTTVFSWLLDIYKLRNRACAKIFTILIFYPLAILSYLLLTLSNLNRPRLLFCRISRPSNSL